jgi:hypothetical protein
MLVHHAEKMSTCSAAQQFRVSKAYVRRYTKNVKFMNVNSKKCFSGLKHSSFQKQKQKLFRLVG